jgi:hypothetical protein
MILKTQAFFQTIYYIWKYGLDGAIKKAAEERMKYEARQRNN